VAKAVTTPERASEHPTIELAINLRTTLLPPYIWAVFVYESRLQGRRASPELRDTTCQTFTVTPGNAGLASGSVFNPAGTSGGVYAGNPGTPSLANGSATAVSQYDIACFQQTTH
jgi:hypothetical protein